MAIKTSAREWKNAGVPERLHGQVLTTEDPIVQKTVAQIKALDI